MEKSKFAALGERLRIGGERLRSGSVEMGKKVGDKMKEILHGQSPESKMVDEATLETLEEPNWGLNLRICSLLNNDELNGQEVMRAVKKKIAGKNGVSQSLSLDLLEACAMNCDKVFSEVASEKVLEEMVTMIDNPQTLQSNKRRAMQLIKAWGESEDLQYLPIFHQTYLSLKERQLTSQLDDGDAASAGISQFSPVPEGYPFPEMAQHIEAYEDYRSPLSVEEKRELLAVARNSMEILSSILNSQLPQEAIGDELTLSMLEKCKDSQPVIQRILESVGDDEVLLFDALNLHEELQQVLCKYAEIEKLATSEEDPPAPSISILTEEEQDDGYTQGEHKGMHATGTDHNVKD